MCVALNNRMFPLIIPYIFLYEKFLPGELINRKKCPCCSFLLIPSISSISFFRIQASQGKYIFQFGVLYSTKHLINR